MKRLTVICAALLMLGGTALADSRRVPASKLPQQAQAFTRKCYPSAKIVSTSMDRELFDATYDVALDDGTQIEFSRHGEWREITAPKGGSVSAAAVPAKIIVYVQKTYPYGNTGVRCIERDGRGYDVQLTNGVDVEFDSRCDMTSTSDYYQHKPDHRFRLQ